MFVVVGLLLFLYFVGDWIVDLGYVAGLVLDSMVTVVVCGND